MEGEEGKTSDPQLSDFIYRYIGCPLLRWGRWGIDGKTKGLVLVLLRLMPQKRLSGAVKSVISAEHNNESWKYHLWSTYYVLGTILRAFICVTHVVLINNMMR